MLTLQSGLQGHKLFDLQEASSEESFQSVSWQVLTKPNRVSKEQLRHRTQKNKCDEYNQEISSRIQ